MKKLNNYPEGWSLSKIEDICQVKGRVGWKGYTKEDLMESGPLTLGAMHIDSNNKLDLTEPVFLSKEKFEESPEIMVNKGDIIMAQRGSLGKVALIDKGIGEATINPSMVLLKGIKINSKYLYYALCSDNIQQTILSETSQTSIPMISQKQINNFLIPVPPLPEQEKISDVLSSVEEAIEKTQEIIEQADEVKKGLMKQLLTKGIGNTRFKETELGIIPEEWDISTFSFLCDLRSEKFNPKIDKNMTYIGLEHIEQGTGKVLGSGNSKDTSSIKAVFKKGDVLFGKLRPYLKKYWLADFDGVCVTEILPLVARENMLPEFLFLLLQQAEFIDYVSQRSFGTKMPRTSWDEIKGYPCFVPPIEEQKRIVKVVSVFEKKIDLERGALKYLSEIKKGLMQSLLTGKIRVKVDEAEVTQV
ncbi:restriction endonuclease subunit S [Bacillus toyonensis]|uniref:restriction endonuclease subunit S n=1 Tax=Bacillus toyonensis TaxID=155322 RepID=UPI00259E0959|nr:restriction endonuclease subunit S [Bacillus toyonensis]MDM5257063.1 restriction endonuclease subunit S [Bacillus toyonensis]